MYRCEHCKGEKLCPSCDYEVDQEVLPCNLPSALWVRVAQRGGPKLEGVKVTVAKQRPKDTAENGFAVFDPVPSENHTIELDLSGNDFDKKYKATSSKRQNVERGQTALVTFELDPLANATVDPARVVLFVTGKPKKVKLSTDTLYDGPGTLTGVDTSKLAAIPPAQQAGAEVSLAPKDSATTWDGLALTWKLDVVPGKSAEAKVCVVKATMEPCWPLDDEPIEASKKLDPGLVVALKTSSNDKPPRAKVRLAVEPKGFDGKLQLQSKASKVKFFAKADGTDEITEIQGPFTGEKAIFIEGAAASGAKLDEEVRLLAEGDVIDRFAVTVVQTELVIHEDVVRQPRGTDDTYTAIPGKARVMHPDPKHKRVRAKLLVKKTPWDAPCVVQLAKEGTGAIAAFRKERKLKVGSTNPTWSLEHHHEKETALVLPSSHNVKAAFANPTKDFVGDKPVWLWLEGQTVGEAKLSVGIDKVQAKVDTITLTVRKPKLKIEVTRRFSGVAPAAGDVAVKLAVMGTGAAALSGVPTLAATDAFQEAEVDVDDYRLSLDPQAVGEKDARVLRTEPKGDDASISVTGDTVVKFELASKYTKVQFIAYWVYTGQSKGIDAKKDAHDDRVAQSRLDMKAKAALMKAAIAKITTDRPADIAGADTLKIFMAPEFAFRGAQGAYPIEVVAEVFDELAPEIDKGTYDDWLFVAGTGVGTVTSYEAVTDANKIVQATTRSVTRLKHPGTQVVNPKRARYLLDYPGKKRPQEGWAMLEPYVGSVVSRGKRPAPDNHWVKVDHLSTTAVPKKGVLVGAAKFVDPPEVEIANVAMVRKGGTKVPSGGDGRGLRQVLINKEYVAWGDLPTSVDLNHEMFFHAGRQLVTLNGMVCRAKPPKDSTMEGAYLPPWSWTPLAPSITAKSEKSPSGIGGGSAFSIDQIRFGLEICMDHNFSRLAKSIPATEAPHVHLIPSGGASIDSGTVWTVVNGLVFNVDMDRAEARKGTTGINRKGTVIDLTNSASAHYDTARAAGDGKVILYDPADIAY
jgi:hypothetical protein